MAEPQKTNRPGSNLIQQDALRAKIEARLKRIEENLTVHKDLMGGNRAKFNDFLKKLLDEKNKQLLNRYIEDLVSSDKAKLGELLKKLGAEGDAPVAAPLLSRLEPAIRDSVREAAAALPESERRAFVQT